MQNRLWVLKKKSVLSYELLVIHQGSQFSSENQELQILNLLLELVETGGAKIPVQTESSGGASIVEIMRSDLRKPSLLIVI